MKKVIIALVSLCVIGAVVFFVAKKDCKSDCCHVTTECVKVDGCVKADSCCHKAACATPCEKADSCCAAKAECQKACCEKKAECPAQAAE